VWATFRDTLKRERIPVAEAQALLMPSTEADEVEVALNAGFREHNLHVVDKEPAIVATVKRKYPRVNTYGCTASRAVERILAKGVRLSCANFDFTYKVSLPFLEELSKIALMGHFRCTLKEVGEHEFKLELDVPITRGAFEEFCVVAVSVVRGREEGGLAKHWRCTTGLSDDSIEQVEQKVANLNGVSMDRMREGGYVPATDIYKNFAALDRHRLFSIDRILSLEHQAEFFKANTYNTRPMATPKRAEWYLSTNGQTMLWSVWTVESFQRATLTSRLADKKRVEMGIRPIGDAVWQW
jgi:hypothetical protein